MPTKPTDSGPSCKGRTELARIGPAVFTKVGDLALEPGRIHMILWEGVTTLGDTARLNCVVTGALIWAGRTDTTQTYQGANFGPTGLHVPFGVELTQLSAGRVLVYFLEE
ncbi:MAG: hypothetical protein HY323_09100 [Betaproteobacteria bacterium]|nr:hypothetical protein [Betaproteobacteria bacterium]